MRLRRPNVQADLLTVEVTESAVISEPEKALAQLNKLRSAGVRNCHDDYGTWVFIVSSIARYAGKQN